MEEHTYRHELNESKHEKGMKVKSEYLGTLVCIKITAIFCTIPKNIYAIVLYNQCILVPSCLSLVKDYFVNVSKVCKETRKPFLTLLAL